MLCLLFSLLSISNNKLAKTIWKPWNIFKEEAVVILLNQCKFASGDHAEQTSNLLLPAPTSLISLISDAPSYLVAFKHTCNKGYYQIEALMQPSLCLSLKFKSFFFHKHLRLIPPSHFSCLSLLSTVLCQTASTLQAAVAAGVGVEQKMAIVFSAVKRALPHPVLRLPSHAPPATSCVLDCQKWKQTSASFTANVALYEKTTQPYILNRSVLPLFPR